MWRKSDPIGDGSPTLGATDGPKAVHPAASPAQMARIGGSLAIKGDLYGEEDLFIEGTIEGKITVKQGSVTLGERGRVLADIHATNIQVAGNVRWTPFSGPKWGVAKVEPAELNTSWS